MAMYTKEMGPPPIDIDMASSLSPAQRKAAERKAEAQTKKDYPPKPPVKKAMGGMTKKYANRGSVRGAGVAQRGVKQCKVV